MDRWPRSCCPLWPRGTEQAWLLFRLLQSGANAPALVLSCPLSRQASVSPHKERVTLVLPPAHCSLQGRLSCTMRVSGQLHQRLLLLSRAACYTFPRHSPGDCSDRRVPFLKALSTGATTLLSHAEGRPRQRGFHSMRVYYTELWRQAQASSSRIPQTRF